METHDSNRVKVCITCLKRKKDIRPISAEVRNVIRERYYPDIDTLSWFYPSSICITCRLRCKQSLNKVSDDFPYMYKYDYAVTTRSNVKCNCEVCVAADVRVGHKRLQNLPINAEQLSQGRARKENDSVTSNVRLQCEACLTEIGRGIKHSCNPSTRSVNLLKIMKNDNPSPKSTDAAVAKYMLEKAASSENGMIRLSNRRGKPSLFKKQDQKETPAFNKLKAKDLFSMKTEINLSTRQTLGAMKTLKRSGMKIETNAAKKIHEMNSRLKDLFSVVKLGEIDEASDQVKRSQYADVSVAYCNNVKELIKQVKEARSTHGDDDLLKIGVDGGRGFFKVTLSIVAKDSTNESGAFKTGGVKCLFILAIAADLPEKYDYVALIWDKLLHLQELDAVIAGDLKIVNVIVGIMAHSSSYPCPYCNVHKKMLSSNEGLLRTKSIIRGNMNKSDCCVHEPLVPGGADFPILLICPPPPLHLMLGIVNAIFRAVEKKSPDWCDLWVSKANIRHQMMAYGFTGGACKKLIEHVSVLQDNRDLDGFVQVLKCFKAVAEKCFSTTLTPDYGNAIDRFCEKWEELELPASSKYHIIKFHLKQFCSMTGQGLGLFNEQASESVHSNFDITWNRYKATKSSPVYDKRLLAAVVDYNSSHLY